MNTTLFHSSSVTLSHPPIALHLLPPHQHQNHYQKSNNVQSPKEEARSAHHEHAALAGQEKYAVISWLMVRRVVIADMMRWNVFYR